jgi:ABC-type transport system involved in multi-copper enzyme maturation permease subunit
MVREYGTYILNIFALVVLVPALTMRLFAEEKRTGSLEVLLTAPVNEVPVVASKFLASWLFFLFCWVPSGLFLIALRAVGDTPFDYRPVLGFYVALAAQGVMFIGIGLFFSALTRNQVVAAVLTFVVMLLLLGCTLLRFIPGALGLPQFLLDAMGRLSFYHMLRDSLGGQLPLRDVALFVSLGVFWLFLAVKVLEARKWS